jgi:cellulose biosynthesis protein BcsQ
VFTLADAVAVPLIPTPLSVRAFSQVMEFLAQKRLAEGRLFPFFSMVDKRRGLHRQWLDAPPQDLPNLLGAYVPYASVVEQMGQHQSPIAQFAAHSPAAAAYQALWEELRVHLDFD